MDFVFSNVQWLESRSDVVRDICEVCGIEQAKPQPSTEETATMREEEAKRAKEHKELERKVAELQRQIQLQAEQQRKQSQESSDHRSDEKNKQRTSPLINIKRPIKWIVTSTLVLCVAILGIGLYNHQIDKAEAELIAQEQRLAEENRLARARAEQEAKLLAEESAKREAAEREKEQEKHKADNDKIKNALSALNYSDESINIIIANSEDNLIFRSEILSLIERHSKGLITTMKCSERIVFLIGTYANEAKKIEQSINDGKGRNGIYQVGDYYDDGTKKGVVFQVSKDGLSGKIISLKQSHKKWNECEWKIGLDNTYDGMINMKKLIEACPEWKEEYPAFAWCASLGEGWYLPAIQELEAFVKNATVNSKINLTLVKLKSDLLLPSSYYWSSTENGTFYARCAKENSLYDSDDKYDYHLVRAVAAFK